MHFYLALDHQGLPEDTLLQLQFIIEWTVGNLYHPVDTYQHLGLGGWTYASLGDLGDIGDLGHLGILEVSSGYPRPRPFLLMLLTF